ncbi:MAG: fluoride efflux transporter CrcB [Woeseia sp.]|nr:fluoride efflux transporter CrcB [Woeseia sp.]
MIYSYIFVALGGALGAIARFGFNEFLQREYGFPWGTLTANLLGCLFMGLFIQATINIASSSDFVLIPNQYRLFFAIGFCGSFTTLSSLVLEINNMLQKNEIFHSFIYFAGTILGSFACFYIGVMCVRIIMQVQR